MGVVRRIITSCASGTILVFLPGVAEIRECARQPFPWTRSLRLYGGQSEGDRRAVFEPCEGAFKLIYSTDIAEDALTFPDVTHVVDSMWKRWQTKVHGFA